MSRKRKGGKKQRKGQHVKKETKEDYQPPTSSPKKNANAINPWRVGLSVAVVVIVVFVFFVYRQSQTRYALSSIYMKQIMIDVMEHFDRTELFPDSVDLTGRVNPITGDDPGYEYVKPAKYDLDTVVIYQLRYGERDTSLPVAFADGSVGEYPHSRDE
jgi:hypothetical protein